jgi:hypothetical protein
MYETQKESVLYTEYAIKLKKAASRREAALTVSYPSCRSTGCQLLLSYSGYAISQRCPGSSRASQRRNVSRSTLRCRSFWNGPPRLLPCVNPFGENARGGPACIEFSGTTVIKNDHIAPPPDIHLLSQLRYGLHKRTTQNGTAPPCITASPTIAHRIGLPICR